MRIEFGVPLHAAIVEGRQPVIARHGAGGRRKNSRRAIKRRPSVER